MSSPTPAPRTVLLTGFPTFAARYLFETIAREEPDTTIMCIVRERHLEQARALAARVSSPERVRLLAGDIRSLDFGLTGKEYLDLTNEVTDVYHLDALWHTAASKERLKAVNVGGTQNVLDCISDIKNLNRYNHFSTAYVCGDRSGVIMEEELDVGQSFRNPYEETQYEAERRVRQRRRTFPITIYRPSLIIGHSKTGQIDRMTGPYLLMQPLVHMPVDVPLPMPGQGQVPLNLVPVDYVVDAIHAISVQPASEGRTFHIVDPNPLSARMVFEMVALAAGKPLPRGRLPVGVAKIVMRLPFVEAALRPGRSLLDDFDRWCVFNAINTAEVLERGPRCPAFPDYVEAIVEYLRAPGEGDVDLGAREAPAA